MRHVMSQYEKCLDMAKTHTNKKGLDMAETRYECLIHMSRYETCDVSTCLDMSLRHIETFFILMSLDHIETL